MIGADREGFTAERKASTIGDSIASARSPRWLTHIGVVVSIVSVAGVAVWASRQSAPTLPAGSTAIATMFAAIAMFGVNTLLRGERWRLLLRHAGGRPARADCYALMAVGYMGNNVLPARGGDAVRAVLIAPRARIGTRTAVGTMIAERLLDAAVLASLFVLLAYGLLSGLDTGSAAERVGLFVGAGLAVGALAAVLIYVRREDPRVGRLVAFLAPMASPTRELRGAHGMRMGLITLTIWLLESLTLLFAARAVGFGIDPVEALFILSLGGVFALIPAGPGQLGTFDTAIVVGAKAVGASGALALSYLLLLRFVLVVPITLVGIVILLVRYRTSSVRVPWLESKLRAGGSPAVPNPAEARAIKLKPNPSPSRSSTGRHSRSSDS
jgi:glycosyltransferase 2 family protein